MQCDINQLLNRNPDMVASGSLICLPPSDAIAAQHYHQQQCSIYSQDIRSATFFEQAGLPSNYGIPQFQNVQHAVLYWPKSKQLGLALLKTLAGGIAVESTISVLAENQLGGKQLGKTLNQIGHNAQKMDVARKCSLWSVTLSPNAPFDWPKASSAFEVNGLSFTTFPGVFNAGKLDQGSALLLEHLDLPSRCKSVLDLGCGSGVLGLSLKSRQPDVQLTLSDVDTLALASAERNAASFDLSTTIEATDSLQGLAHYDAIVCNPPFHQGKSTDYQFSQTLFSEARQHLHANGELWIVANRHLGYESYANAHCKSVDIVAQGNGFKVMRCRY